MVEVAAVGLDIAKSVFQVHGTYGADEVSVRRQLPRAQLLPTFTALPACLIGIEACARAHFWARELAMLGHQVRTMPAEWQVSGGAPMSGSGAFLPSALRPYLVPGWGDAPI